MLRRARSGIAAWWYRRDLARLARLFKTDKGDQHGYLRHYTKYFASLRHRRLNILEIGIGGYSAPTYGGASLRMWKAYFPKSRIYGIDVYDKRALEEPRLRTFQGGQDDPQFLRRVAAQIGRLDIIIDDGSHVNAHVITAFETLFPFLSVGGLYVIEDTQTSYWPGFGGSSEELMSPTTTMGYLKRVMDGVNYEERIQPGYAPTVFDRSIVGMHVYHNIVFIEKGGNTEGSNYIRGNATSEPWILTDYRRSGVYQPDWTPWGPRTT